MPSSLQARQRLPHYQVLSGERAQFIIHEYALARAFSSFLPGIAGPLGVPLWCFYVNRGQGVCAFGVEDKDGAILEFDPANKAYHQVSQTGFRTFLRLGPEGRFYEPFQEDQANLGQRRSTRMIVAPHELRLEELNEDLGLKVTVRYFTLPQRPLAALCRELCLETLGGDSLDVDCVDGLPVVAPFGLGDLQRKTMGRTMEAWTYAEGLDSGLPYLRQRYSSDDAVEIRSITEGHFFAGHAPGLGAATAIVDPALIFGPNGGLAFPARFAQHGVASGPQRLENRSPCALLHLRGRLEPGQPLRLHSVYGRAANRAQAEACAQELRQPDAFHAWAQDNERCILQAAGVGWIASAMPALDGYALQTFLDNVLRGGLAVGLRDGDRHGVLHLYSRKHGDLERDYNAFSLSPSPFSQGNGAFRDICQNRRNDAWTHPAVGDLSLRSFAELLQLDGNNPLLVQGLAYAWMGGAEGTARLRELLPAPFAATLLQRLEKPISPKQLADLCRDHDCRDRLEALLAAVLTRSQALELAAPGHGYWIDHGFYLSDLLESFEGLYPERLPLLLADPSFSYYDNPLAVVPRAQKIKATPKGWRQYQAVRLDEPKAALLAARSERPDRARSGHGLGPLYRVSLWAKLCCFTANKLASLDPQGRGLEMDSEKPDWNDAVNGLPGLFGSATNESMELLRLLRLLDGWLGLLPSPLRLHVELDALMRGLASAPQEPLAYWRAAGALKESYRAQTRLGVDGAETAWDRAALHSFFQQGIQRLERGLAEARRPDGLLDTYYVNAPQMGPGPDPLAHARFVPEAMPLFLEGQVHALRLCDRPQAQALANAVEASELYDRPLGMFKLNAPLDGAPMELGRVRAFTPGWLENESIFMHMEFKYLLALAKQGLWQDFYRHFQAACPAFMDPARYGRSVFENSSFIASSANPDPAMRGQGFVARLSGTTGEFYDLLLTLALGQRPFHHGPEGLRFAPQPALPGAWFRAEASSVVIPGLEARGPQALPAGAFALRLFGSTLIVVQGRAGRDCFGPGALRVQSLRLQDRHGIREHGPSLGHAAAVALRAGVFERLDILLG